MLTFSLNVPQNLYKIALRFIKIRENKQIVRDDGSNNKIFDNFKNKEFKLPSNFVT